MSSGWARHLQSFFLLLMAVSAVGGAALFSQADQAARIAADAQTLGGLQAAAGETATYRAALVIAFASIGETVPQVTLDAVDEAIVAAERIVGHLDSHPDLRAIAVSLVADTEEVRDLLDRHDSSPARDLVEADVLPVVSELATKLGREIAIVSGQIEGEQARAGSLARAASFVVALIVPILAVVLVRSLAHRRLERERLESEMLRHKDLAEAKDRLIAGLSHQLRTPITGIYGWSDLLRQSPDLVDEGSMAILAQAGDLRRMVDDILVAARLESTELAYRPAPSQIGKLVANAVSHFDRVGIEIRVACAEAVVQVDGPRLEQAIHNLVSNALRHGEPPVELVGRVTGSVYRLAVIDRGKGLDENRMADPFAPFAHAPENITTTNSLGLGLWVANSIAQMTGGAIEYLRHDGCTVFVMTLPLADSADPAAAEGPTEFVPAQGGSVLAEAT